MASKKPQHEVLSEVVRIKGQGLKMLSLGYPDLLITEAMVEEHFGADVARQLAFRDDSAEIIKWHGLTDRIS